MRRHCYPQRVIVNAIVPVAGFGTRLLPATKSQPKEMLPVARKPIVQYVSEELVNNGLKQILFVTGRGKTSIENHFDHDPELSRLLEKTNKHELLEALNFSEMDVKYFYTRQPVQRGLGDAILCGESFAGQNPFVVALGDSIIGLNGKSSTVARMVHLFQTHHAAAIVAVEEVPREEVRHYGIVDPASMDGDVIRVANLIEKPAVDAAPSNLAIAARYVFSPLIFDLIKQVEPDHRGEVQLTNAIQRMCEEGRRVLAVKLPATERRFDIGNFPSYYESFVEFALADPEHGPALRERLKQLLAD
ncbi:MAG: UTP--glucose-1-phosphate uridylyltransferase [Bryobacterales bacterium]|jgi:UTP--glucose-1-phosphate uridylyltransferase|nr:UTP--glucose-1-phosphate uridylyltransferase [Bryobacterales bacterium]